MGKPSYDGECSDKLHLKTYLEMLWSKTGYLDYCGTIIYFYYPIICYRRIKFYRVETMDMGISHWYNGVTGMIIISITTMVNIIRDMILW